MDVAFYRGQTKDSGRSICAGEIRPLGLYFTAIAMIPASLWAPRDVLADRYPSFRVSTQRKVILV